MKKRVYLASFVRYFISGGIAALIHFITLILLVEQLNIHPAISTSVGFCLAVIFSYLAQYYWTFRPVGTHKRFIIRFLAVTIISFNINIGLFWFLTEVQKIPYVIAQVLTTFTLFLLNFLINRHFTFKSHHVRQNKCK